MTKLDSGLGQQIQPTPAEKIAALNLPDEQVAVINDAITQGIADSQARATLNLTQAARLYAWVCAQEDPQAAVDAIINAK
jgi:hypothetical protein